MGPGDLVRLENPTDQPFKGTYLTNTITLPPHSSTIVAWEYMVKWMGNPDLVNIDHRRRFRDDENKRLRTLYGAYYDDNIWEQNKPKLNAYDSATGDRIFTVVDDPSGEHADQTVKGIASQALLEQQLELLKTQVKALQQQVITGQNEMAANEYEVGQDLPATPDPNAELLNNNPLVPNEGVETQLGPSPEPAPEDRPQVVKVV